MASGRKDYFRHSVHAHNDEKIVGLIDEGGFRAYGIFWMILELCGLEYVQSGQRNNYIFRKSYLARKSGIRWRYLEPTLRLLEAYRLGNFKVTDEVGRRSDSGTVEVSIPNFSKYIGSYPQEHPKNSPNKIKRNKKKVYIVEKPATLTQDKALLDLLPDAQGYLDSTYKLCDQRKLQSFIDEYGHEAVTDYLDRMHNYIESTGKKYKCYVSAMRAWCRKDGTSKLITNLFVTDPEVEKMANMEMGELVSYLKESNKND